jgi:hypothetical protein
LIYKKNRKLAKFVLRAPVDSTSSVPLQNGDKARKQFLCVGIREMFVCYSSATRIQKSTEKNRHVNKAFCGGIGNLRTLVVCVNVALFPWPTQIT